MHAVTEYTKLQRCNFAAFWIMKKRANIHANGQQPFARVGKKLKLQIKIMNNTHLAAVSCDADVVPHVVVEPATRGLHQGLEGARAQVDDQPEGSVPQRQVDVVGRAARVQ